MQDHPGAVFLNGSLCTRTGTTTHFSFPQNTPEQSPGERTPENNAKAISLAGGEHANGSDYDGTGIGRLWPILSGERGIYEVAAGQDADGYLTAMMTAANGSGLIPEQVWGNEAPAGYTPGTPTKSMNPLNWAMGEYITLLFSISEHTIADVVPITSQRYTSQ